MSDGENFPDTADKINEAAKISDENYKNKLNDIEKQYGRDSPEYQRAMNDLNAEYVDPNSASNRTIIKSIKDFMGEAISSFVETVNRAISSILTEVNQDDSKGVELSVIAGDNSAKPKTINKGSTAGEVAQAIYDAIKEVMDKSSLKQLQGVTITIDWGGTNNVKIDLSKGGEQVTEGLESNLSENAPSFTSATDGPTQQAAENIRSNITGDSTPSQASERINREAENIVQNDSNVDRVVNDADNKRARSTEIDPRPREPDENAKWAKIALVFKILGALIGTAGSVFTGVLIYYEIVKICQEKTGCYQVRSTANGPIQNKIYCKDNDNNNNTYSQKHCDCKPTEVGTCKNDDPCNCYPDQILRGGQAALHEACNTTKADEELYYYYRIYTPIDAIGDLISGSVDFLSKTGDALFSKILKWGLILFGTILGLLLIYTLIRVLATKELEKAYDTKP